MRVQGFGYLSFSRIDRSRGNLLSVRLNSWNEARAAGIHHIIESLPGLNATDFVNRIQGKGGDIEILFRAGRAFGRSKQRCAALHRPCQQHLRRRLSNSCGD